MKAPCCKCTLEKTCNKSHTCKQYITWKKQEEKKRGKRI